MKNLSLILNIVLLAAVAVLYFLHFSSNNETSEIAGEESSATFDKSKLKIAYVNSDSLISNFDFFQEKSEELKEERSKSETDLENRARGIEKQVNDFQRTRGNMTINQARAIEEDLYKKQQNLLQYRENLAQNLLKKESEINNELYDKVSSYLKEYGIANKMEIVLSYTRNSGVLYAHDSLDITQVVITGLNEAYRNQNTVKADSTGSN
ncbi:OmpH family outer membrane protein [Fulvivirgaceae bacterium BMA12]|uniref:OmpH family outer membrane protein n=1 Tax=Agaribacillus aureus TaxID=3051825 RepID=A0ABT8LIZ3_9BACT|nr:OmpH family outer membrane protein [Fulvivirgaceae bacterium BMA12]